MNAIMDLNGTDLLMFFQNASVFKLKVIVRHTVWTDWFKCNRNLAMRIQKLKLVRATPFKFLCGTLGSIHWNTFAGEVRIFRMTVTRWFRSCSNHLIWAFSEYSKDARHRAWRFGGLFFESQELKQLICSPFVDQPFLLQRIKLVVYLINFGFKFERLCLSLVG